MDRHIERSSLSPAGGGGAGRLRRQRLALDLDGHRCLSQAQQQPRQTPGFRRHIEQVELFQRLRVFQAPWARVLLVILAAPDGVDAIPSDGPEIAVDLPQAAPVDPAAVEAEAVLPAAVAASAVPASHAGAY